MEEIIKIKPGMGEWPVAFLEMPDPPKELYIEGQWPAPEFIFLTVVGSRRFSNYGKEVCEDLIAGLAGYPIAIVSGLAIGIDTIAHKAALKAKLPTIAFPGSGLDRSVLHPSSNKKLAEEIIYAGGALVAEYEPLMPAGIHTFPKRNRLMAALSKASLIIEAGDKSGTLITARLALDYNREVLAVPGAIFNPGSKGTNGLIRLGATPITCSKDILEALGFNTPTDEEAKQASLFTNLSENEQKIVELLQVEPLPRDELIILSNLSAAEANSTLAVLEIKGLIKETMGEVRLS
ncbi:MAG: DNA-processing protein DprA [bacterium]|nr:DNA-processing protein DprA [bacterium]